MATADFSPIYRDDPETHEDSGAEVEVDPSAVAAADIDYNDPNLLMQEIVGADPTADAYATPPPPPDGWYRCKLKQIDVKRKDNTKGQFAVMPDMDYSVTPPVQKKHPKTGEGMKYVTTAIEARIQDPGGMYDNIPVFDRFVDSRVNPRNKGVPILTVLSALKVKVPVPYNGDVLIKTLLKALAGEPECDVEVTWEGSPDQADNDKIKAAGGKVPRVRGMHRFPEVGGRRVPDMPGEVSGLAPGTSMKVNLHAQAKVTGYQPVGTKTKKK
jgi:hypothetical protein